MILDTSGLLCMHDADERHHIEALEVYRKARVRLTHAYVLAEVHFSCARPSPAAAASAFIHACRAQQPRCRDDMVGEALHREALNLLNARIDKTYSLCDAVSFVLMRQRQITDALSTDRHFEQEGFRRLLA